MAVSKRRRRAKRPFGKKKHTLAAQQWKEQMVKKIDIPRQVYYLLPHNSLLISLHRRGPHPTRLLNLLMKQDPDVFAGCKFNDLVQVVTVILSAFHNKSMYLLDSTYTCLPIQSITVHLPESWDIQQYAKLAKAFRVGSKQSKSELKLAKAFPNPELGCISKPAVIVDGKDNIILFYLPGIIPKRLMVCCHNYFLSGLFIITTESLRASSFTFTMGCQQEGVNQAQLADQYTILLQAHYTAPVNWLYRPLSRVSCHGPGMSQVPSLNWLLILHFAAKQRHSSLPDHEAPSCQICCDTYSTI